jgi:hypothetical protein
VLHGIRKRFNSYLVGMRYTQREREGKMVRERERETVNTQAVCRSLIWIILLTEEALLFYS